MRMPFIFPAWPSVPEYDPTEVCAHCHFAFDADDCPKIRGEWVCEECALQCIGCGETKPLNADGECVACSMIDLPVPTAEDITRLFGMEAA